MARVGTAALPLHGGKAPKWLFGRMVSLASAISGAMVEEFGSDLFIRRISDPYWFQAFSCVLGFDWHSSGTTTVTCGAMKEALKENDLGLAMAGGKGRASRKTPQEILDKAPRLSLTDAKTAELVRTSRLSAKVDSAAIQDGYGLYHHTMLFNEHGNWTVIQQGMNDSNGYARRYHWLSDDVTSFVEEPHQAILCDGRAEEVLDMTAVTSGDSRSISVDLINDGPAHLRSAVREVRHPSQTTLDNWNGGEGKALFMPRGINWAAMDRAYDVQPSSYEELLEVKGVGPSTVRALALIGELVYGSGPSWRDPVKYSYTVGGKDGVPYPVDRGTMDRVTEIIEAGVREAKMKDREKLDAIQRLRRFVPPDADLQT